MKQENCTVKSCINFGRYCRLHVAGRIKIATPIAKRSEKLGKVMKKEYVPQVKEMVAKGTRCAIKSPACIGEAQGFHHPEGRETKKKLLKKKVPSCNPCNLFIEVNDAWARQNGHKKSKHANYKREK